MSRVTYLSAGGSAGPELRVGVEDPVAVWGGGAGVWHRDGAGRGIGRRGLVVFPSVGDGDGEGPEARNAATIPLNGIVRDGPKAEGAGAYLELVAEGGDMEEASPSSGPRSSRP